MSSERLEDLYRIAKARKAEAERGQVIPPELWLSESCYLTNDEKTEVHDIKQNLPTFWELQKLAKARLKNRKRGRK